MSFLKEESRFLKLRSKNYFLRTIFDCWENFAEITSSFYSFFFEISVIVVLNSNKIAIIVDWHIDNLISVVGIKTWRYFSSKKKFWRCEEKIFIKTWSLVSVEVKLAISEKELRLPERLITRSISAVWPSLENLSHTHQIIFNLPISLLTRHCTHTFYVSSFFSIHISHAIPINATSLLLCHTKAT